MEDIFIVFGIVMAIAMPFLLGVFIAEYFKYKREVGVHLKEVRIELAHLNNEALKQELASHKERIETLETIVTDAKYELGNKIQRLR